MHYKQLFIIFVVSIKQNEMELSRIEKLELHLIRLEQAIKQVQRLRQMGLPDNVIDEKIDRYLDEMLETRNEIEKLKKQNEEEEG